MPFVKYNIKHNSLKLIMTTHTIISLIKSLDLFWSAQGSTLTLPYDSRMGAATLHPKTFFNALNPLPGFYHFTQPCSRSQDSRYGKSNNRLFQHHQFQVIVKPPQENFLDLYKQSLKAVGFNPTIHDLKLIEDNWKSIGIGAWGLGYEAKMNNMEISQVTYFQQVGGIKCEPITGEIAYGLERMSLLLQNKSSVWELQWDDKTKYKDLFYEREKEFSTYNIEYQDLCISDLHRCNEICETLITDKLPIVAYDMLIQSNHIFNILDARNNITESIKIENISILKNLSMKIAQSYLHLIENNNL